MKPRKASRKAKAKITLAALEAATKIKERNRER